MWADAHIHTNPDCAIRTLRQAQNYRGWWQSALQQFFVIFEVPVESEAYDLGYRHHVAPEQEVPELEIRNIKVLKEDSPQ